MTAEASVKVQHLPNPEHASRTRRLAAWAVVVVTLVCVCSTALIAVVNAGWDWDSPSSTAPLFAMLGALVLVRQPDNRIGVVLAAIGVLAAVGGLSEAITAAHYGRGTLTLAGAAWAGWVGDWYWLPMLWLQFVALPLLFPDGRLPSLRWRWFGRAVWLFATVVTLLAMFAADLVLDGVQLGVDWRTDPRSVVVANPVGILPLGNFEEDAGTLLVLVFLSTLGAAGALIGRFRRSSGVERHQIKVAVAGVATTAIGFVGFAVLDMAGFTAADPLEIVLFLAIPGSLGVAILRYRLYDIDRLISRTLAYVLVTASLVGVYLGVVVVAQPLLRPLTGGGDLGVALATLAAAAAFRPLLRRIQHVVDRRFNRRVHDARQAVDRFADRLRDEVDASAVERDLRTTATGILQPATASVWMAPTEAST